MLMGYLGSTAVAYKEFISGNDSSAGSAILIAKTFAVIGDKESGILSYVPTTHRFPNIRPSLLQRFWLDPLPE